MHGQIRDRRRQLGKTGYVRYVDPAFQRRLIYEVTGDVFSQSADERYRNTHFREKRGFI